MPLHTYAERIRESRRDPTTLVGEAFTLGIGSKRKGYSNKISDFMLERQTNLDYFCHVERFDKRPQLGTTFDNAATLAITDPADAPANVDALRDDLVANTFPSIETWANTTLADYNTQAFQASRTIELFGTNADNAGVTFLEGGGIRLETAGADADQHILGAHLETTMTALAGINWDSANEPLFCANIVTGPQAADLHDTTLWAGFKLTNTDVVITDDDQFFFRTDGAGAVAGNWFAVQSVGGTDVEFDTGILAVEATPYQLFVVLDENRVPHYYINGAYVWTGTAQATALATYEFYVGVAARGVGAAKQLDIRNLLVSQTYG